MKMLLLIGIPVILIVAVGVVLLFTDFGQKLLGKDTGGEGEQAEEKKIEHIDPAGIAFYEVPELLVNLQSKRGKSPFLRLSLKLELADAEGIKQLDLIKPRIINSFQLYLRDLSLDDLTGSVGTQRIREELLRRANEAAEEVHTKIRDVLIQTFVVQ